MNRSILLLLSLISLNGCDGTLSYPVHIDLDIDGALGSGSGSGSGGDDSGTPIIDPMEPGLTPVDERVAVEISPRVHSMDIAILLDTTASMTSIVDEVQASFERFAESMSDTVEDPAYGIATFDDYAFSTFGSQLSGDKPFRLQQPITTDPSMSGEVLSLVEIHLGWDAPESGMEALYQSLTGAGYDQNANSIYDSATDVRPLFASTDDPFAGSAAGSSELLGADEGSGGGLGFREGSLPVIIYLTDAQMRDPHLGHASPGGAPQDADSISVINAANATGTRLIGLPVGLTELGPMEQMNFLARETGSQYDADGDGLVDDPLVYTVADSWGDDDTIIPTMTQAVQDMLGSLTFHEVTARIVEETPGLTVKVSPAVINDVRIGSSTMPLEFSVSVTGVVEESGEERVVPLTLEIYGDDTTLLGSEKIEIVIPPSI
jgi:hypothetical protein